MSILESTGKLNIKNEDVLKQEEHFIETFKKYKGKKWNKGREKMFSEML